MTSTSVAEMCCKTLLTGVWCNDMPQAENPWRTHPVQLVLDLPVAPDPARELGGLSLGRGQ